MNPKHVNINTAAAEMSSKGSRLAALLPALNTKLLFQEQFPDATDAARRGELFEENTGDVSRVSTFFISI